MEVKKEAMLDLDSKNPYQQPGPSSPAQGSVPVAPPPVKVKKPKRLTKFNDDWCRTYDWLTRGRHEYHAHCWVCDSNFSVGHGGEYDVQKHSKTVSHNNNLGLQQGKAPLTKKLYLVVAKAPPTKKRSNSVIAAESTFVYHSVRHTHSFMSADCAGALFHSLFTDSKIAEKYRCGRTKATKIVTQVLGPESRVVLLNDLRDGRPFSIATDASNRGHITTFPLLVQYFKPREGVQNKLLCFFTNKDGTPASIAEAILQQLARWGLAATRLTAYAAENALASVPESNHFGAGVEVEKEHVSIVSELRRTYPNLLAVGCSGRFIHQAARAAQSVLMFDMEVVVVKVYNELSNSNRRVPDLVDLFEWMDSEWSELLHHLPSRWLSVVPAVERLVKHFESVKYYFLAEPHSNPTPPIVKQFFEHKLAEAYLGFVLYVGQILNRTVARLESREASVIELYAIMAELRTSLQTKKDEKFYGSAARQALARCWDDQSAYCFTFEADAYLAHVVGQLGTWFCSCDDGKLQLLSALSLDGPATAIAKMTVTSLNLDAVLAVVATFKIGEVDVDALFEELVALKNFVAGQQEDHFQNLDVESKWVEFFKVQAAPNLERIMVHVLSIPPSNAKSEKIFSLMKSSWRTNRNRLHLATLEAELMVKQNYTFTCKEFRKHLESKEGAHLLSKLKSNKKYN